MYRGIPSRQGGLCSFHSRAATALIEDEPRVRLFSPARDPIPGSVFRVRSRGRIAVQHLGHPVAVERAGVVLHEIDEDQDRRQTLLRVLAELFGRFARPASSHRRVLRRRPRVPSIFLHAGADLPCDPIVFNTLDLPDRFGASEPHSPIRCLPFTGIGYFLPPNPGLPRPEITFDESFAGVLVPSFRFPDPFQEFAPSPRDRVRQRRDRHRFPRSPRPLPFLAGLQGAERRLVVDLDLSRHGVVSSRLRPPDDGDRVRPVVPHGQRVRFALPAVEDPDVIDVAFDSFRLRRSVSGPEDERCARLPGSILPVVHVSMLWPFEPGCLRGPRSLSAVRRRDHRRAPRVAHDRSGWPPPRLRRRRSPGVDLFGQPGDAAPRIRQVRANRITRIAAPPAARRSPRGRPDAAPPPP